MLTVDDDWHFPGSIRVVGKSLQVSLSQKRLFLSEADFVKIEVHIFLEKGDPGSVGERTYFAGYKGDLFIHR